MRTSSLLRKGIAHKSIVALSVLAAAAVQPHAHAAADPCKALREAKFTLSQISLPTTGAEVTSAHRSHTAGTSFCKVMGRIHPVDPDADDIRFELNLPETFNGRALQYGGGSFDGWLGATNGLKHTAVEVHSEPTPLARGYATFGSDAGHHHIYFPFPDAVNSLNAKFARNAEMQRNFAGDALKKVHDVAVLLMTQRYGKPPAHMYFIGGSTGGREALRVAQRYPQDYDGVLAAYAAWDQIELDLQFIRTAQALYAPGGFLGRSQTRLIERRVEALCDAQDGLRDGLVSNPAGCHVDPAGLRCADGKAHHGCLSDPQLHTLQTYATEQHTDFDLPLGINSIPGYNVLSGADLTGSTGLLHHPERNPILLFNSFGYVIGDDVLRNFLPVGYHYDSRHFNTTTGDPGPSAKPPALNLAQWQALLVAQGREIDSANPDLGPFFARGGKLILVHGASDTIIPANSTVDYFSKLQQATGPEAAANGARLYIIPGLGHGFGRFNAGFDTVGTLDAWVDKGVAPANLIVTDNHRQRRTRPLCAWPAWPRYNGSGDPDNAASFSCAAGK